MSTTIAQDFISVLTWNCWFDTFEFDKRFHEIMNICKSLRPDVMCFQEVTPGFCHLMAAMPRREWLQEYQCSDENYSGSSVEPYGTMTLCKDSWNPTFQRHALPTFMDRDLLVVNLQHNHFVKSRFAIGNVHLESLANPDVRSEQLLVCSNILPQSSSLLCGDFNFCSYRNFKIDDRYNC